MKQKYVLMIYVMREKNWCICNACVCEYLKQLNAISSSNIIKRKIKHQDHFNNCFVRACKHNLKEYNHFICDA